MAHPVPGYKITTGYKKPGRLWAAGYHTGVDLAAPTGTKVYSTTDGTVKHVGWGGWGRAYGVHVIVQDSSGYRHGYMHLSATSVRVGQRVRAGTQVGRIGVTGNTTGPHLHLETRRSPYRYNNKIVNPELFFGATAGLEATTKTYLSRLKYGQRNSDSVKELQRALNKQYPDANIPVTGNYLSQTDKWVRKHQKDIKTKPDKKRKSFVGPVQAKALKLKNVVR
jgi:murein DD-endopeptidase MepM/ murein hydrolase activator NlpD